MRKNTTAFPPSIRARCRYAQALTRVAFIAAIFALALYACGGKTAPPPVPQKEQPLQAMENNATATPSPPIPDSNGTYSETVLNNSKQPQADQNATAGVMLPGLPYGEPDAESHDLQATACIQVKDYMGKNMQELQDILHAMIQKKLIIAALSDSSDDAAMAKLPQQVDNSLLSGLIIDKEGYYNGDSFGKLCVDARGKLSQTLMAQYQKKRLSLTDFCYSNASLADNVLRPHAMAAALKQLISRPDSRLGELSVSEIRDTLSQITISNEHLDIRNHRICLDIVADYDPMQARRVLQAHVIAETKQQEPPKAARMHLAHYSLYLDITPYSVGRPMPDYGDAISVVEGPQGKALSLTGTTSGWALFTDLNQAGKPVPSALENNGNPPGPEDRFIFDDHPIGDFNATIQIAYAIHLTPADSPLELQLLQFEYKDYVTQSVSISLTLDDARRKHVSFDLGHTHTNILPFDWGQKPVNLTLQKEKDVLKLFVEKQFIISVPSPVSPLSSISVNLLNDSMLYALQVEGEEARPQPKPPTGVAGMIPHSSKWQVPTLPSQQPGAKSVQPAGTPDGQATDRQPGQPGQAAPADSAPTDHQPAQSTPAADAAPKEAGK